MSARLVAKLLRRAVAEHLALVQQDDFVTAFRFVHVGRAEQHAQAFPFHEAINNLPKFTP